MEKDKTLRKCREPANVKSTSKRKAKTFAKADDMFMFMVLIKKNKF